MDTDKLYAMDEMQSDEELMLSYAAGDIDAFAVLYEKHKGPVFRYMLNLCQHEAIAEELFQEVWIKLINARENYVVSAKFTTYLYRLAHNQFIDHYRKQNVRVVEDLSENMDEFPAQESVVSEPENNLYTKQLEQQFMYALNSLSHEQREVFLLREESNMSLQEIADTLGINHEAAKSRLRYAIKRLRLSLADD